MGRKKKQQPQGQGIGAQIDRLMRAKGWDQGDLAERSGYADPSHVSRVLNGQNDNHAIVRLAKGLGCEVRIVPPGSVDSVLSRAHEADKHELSVVADLLDFLIEFRDDPGALEYFKKDIPRLREQIRSRRALVGRTAS